MEGDRGSSIRRITRRNGSTLSLSYDMILSIVCCFQADLLAYLDVDRVEGGGWIRRVTCTWDLCGVGAFDELFLQLAQCRGGFYTL